MTRLVRTRRTIVAEHVAPLASYRDSLGRQMSEAAVTAWEQVQRPKLPRDAKVTTEVAFELEVPPTLCAQHADFEHDADLPCVVALADYDAEISAGIAESVR